MKCSGGMEHKTNGWIKGGPDVAHDCKAEILNSS